MSRLILFFVLVITYFFVADLTVYASPDLTTDQIKERLYSDLEGRAQNATGYEFFVAIPPNDAESNIIDCFVEVYVASSKATEVDLYFAGVKIETINIQPYIVKVIKLDNKKCEIRKSEQALNQTYRLVSKDNPISVYVLDSKAGSAEGFMVLPVGAYGKEYIHCSYWENGESKSNYFKSGFIVISSEDDCLVTIKLKSAGNALGHTDKGRAPGEVWQVTIKKGECYKVCTDAASIGEFDISGTQINATKPIGVLSFHERATLPRLSVTSRNHLVEMIPSTEKWNYQYISLELPRNKNGGDLFRIICKDPNTHWSVSWFDTKNMTKIDSKTGLLQNTGDFVELVDESRERPNDSFTSIRGTAVFFADKPIQVYQYAFSGAWDKSTDIDPCFMTLCSPDNFNNSTEYQIAENANYTDNYFTLFAKADTSDNAAILKSINLIRKTGVSYDTMNIINKYPNFASNFIPDETGLLGHYYWIRIPLEKGFYKIIGDTKLGGYVIGKNNTTPYTWLAGASFNNRNKKDVVPPKTYISEINCGVWKIRFTENVNDTNTTNPSILYQEDLGVELAPRLLSSSFNAVLTFTTPYEPGKIYKDFDFRLDVTDKMKSMFAVVAITDRANNTTYDTLRYEPTILTSLPDNKIDFGKNVKYRTNPLKTITLENKNTYPVEIRAIYLKNNEVNSDHSPFQITKGHYLQSSSAPLTLAPGGTRMIQVEYFTLNNALNVESTDSIVVETKCELKYFFPISGNSTAPIMNVSNCDFGKILTNNTKYSDFKIYIQNKGSDTLVVYSAELEDKKVIFSANAGTPKVSFPITINPGTSFTLNNYGKFSPYIDGAFTTNVTFSANGDPILSDFISEWKGEAVPASSVSEYNKSGSTVKISPNPVNSGKCTIELNEATTSEISKIEIMDESGKIVKVFNNISLSDNKINLDISGIALGNYLVKISKSDNAIYGKISIVK